MSLLFRPLFKYIFKRIFGTFIKNDINFDEINFSLSSLRLNDIEMNTYEINKLMGDSPFKLVSMTIKSIDVPWSLVKLNWGEVKIDGIEVLLMPAPTQRDNDSNLKDNPIEESTSNQNEESKDMYDSEVSLSSSLITKLLSNIGVRISNIAVKILPCEFGIEHESLEALPTLLFRISYFQLCKQDDEVKIESPTNENKYNNFTDEIKKPLKDTQNNEEALPMILLIAKRKCIKLGQMSLHLLSSPFNIETKQKYGDDELEFPYQLPRTESITTILCIGNPENREVPSFEVLLNQSRNNKKKFEIRAILYTFDLIIDPIQLLTINSIIKNINHVIDKKIQDPECESAEVQIKKISKQIIRDFTVQENKDEDIKTIISEIRGEIDVNDLISDTMTESEANFDTQSIDSNILEFSVQFELKMLSIACIYDHSNTHRGYDRIFDAYFQIDNQNPCGMKEQSLIGIAGNHFLLCVKGMKALLNLSNNIDVNLIVTQISLYDYILHNWRLPSQKDGKDTCKNKDAETSIRESIIERSKFRKSFMSRLSKRSISKSTLKSKMINTSIRSSTGDIFYDTNDEVNENDDGLSFKSCINSEFQNKQYEVESSIAESQFIDAHDTDEIWFLNPLIQHFSIIPIFTMNTFKNISKSIEENVESKLLSSSVFNHHSIKTSTIGSSKLKGRGFQFIHQLIDKNNFEILSDSEASSDEEEKAIKLNDSSDSVHSHNSNCKELNNAIEIRFIVNKSIPRPDRPTLYLIDTEIEMQNIFIELVPSSIIGISSFISPFEYFYHSAIDSNLKNYSKFITESYSIPESKTSNKSKSPNKKNNVIIGDIKLEKVPYIGMLIYFINPEIKYFQEIYKNRIGEFMSQNHFINEEDHIIYEPAFSNQQSYAYDMIQKQILIRGNKEQNVCERLLDKLSMLIEIQDFEVYFEPNAKEIEIELRSTTVSLINDILKESIVKIDKVVIDNFQSTDVKQKETTETNLNLNANKTYFYSDYCGKICEVDSDEENDFEKTNLDELNLIFGKKKSVDHQHDMTHIKAKKNYFHIDFAEKIKICVTQNHLLNLTSLIDNAMNQVNSIKTIFYAANSCTMDISGNLELSSKDLLMGSTSSTPEDIDDYLEQISSSNCEELDKSQYKSTFKLDITIKMLQFDLIDAENYYEESITYSICEQKEEFNPFLSTFDVKDSPNKSKRIETSKQNIPTDFNKENTKLSLLSFLAEDLCVKINILDDLEKMKKAKNIAIDFTICDLIVVDHLFLNYSDFSSRLISESEKIPLHPKLFDAECKKEYQCNYYIVNIESILVNHPERVLFYIQRVLKDKTCKTKINCIKLEIVLSLKNDLSSISDQYAPSDKMINMYKSLKRKLPFELFTKYCCFYFEPIIKNNTKIYIEIKGLIAKLTSIHNLVEFIPNLSEAKEKEDFVIKSNSSLSLIISIEDCGADYTPCVTNKALLKIYKNFDYDIKNQDSDSSEEEIAKISSFYQTNTRMVIIFGSTLVTIKGNDKNMSICVIAKDFETYLLWAKDYSIKWSSELLLDENKLINNGQGDILYKMGFVNVITIDQAEVNINKELQKVDAKTGIIFKPIDSIVSFSDLIEFTKQKIPSIVLKSDTVESGPLNIELIVSSFSVYCCHDSIICFILFSQAADFHLQKSLKRLSKKRVEKSNSNEELQKDKVSVIKEAESSDESDHEEHKFSGDINLTSLLEEHKFHKIKDPKLGK